MNAEQAKALEKTAAEREGGGVEALVEYVLRHVKAAAERGERELVDPLKSLRQRVTETQAAAVWRELRARGYQVWHDEQPKASGTTVRW